MKTNYIDLINTAEKNIEKLNIGELIDVGFLPLSEVYYLTSHYPPYAIYPRCSYEDVYGGFFYPLVTPFSLYIHIPSFFTPKQLVKLLSIIHREFDLSSYRQFSIEVDPKILCGGIGSERLRILKEFKVERICLGAQSFDDDVLKQMGGYHSSDDIKEAMFQIKKRVRGLIC